MPAGLDLYFYPADFGRDTSALLYFHGSRSRAVPIEPLPRAALAAGPHWTGVLNVGDARWTLIAVPIPGGPGIATHTGAWMALLGCLFVSAVGFAYIWTTGSHAQRIEIANTQLDKTNKQFAETNTQLDKTLGVLNTVNADLSARNLQVDAAVDNMVQGFVMFDPQERIVVCNKRYIEMYGLSREIVKPGCSLLEVLQHRAAIGLRRSGRKKSRRLASSRRSGFRATSRFARSRLSLRLGHRSNRSGENLALRSKPVEGTPVRVVVGQESVPCLLLSAV